MKTRIIGAALVVIFGMLATAGWLLRARADKAVEKLSEAIEPLAPAASQPADKIVLVRFGDADRITQAGFERAAAGSDPKKYDRILGDMIVDRIYLLYLRDHPDLVPRAVIEAEIDQQVKISKLKTRDELKRRIEAKGNTWEQVEYQIKIRKAIPALKERGQKLAQDPKYLRQVFDKDRPAFDGTEVSARHIQINVRPSDLRPRSNSSGSDWPKSATSW